MRLGRCVAAVGLLGMLIVTSAYAAKRSHRKPTPDKPSITGCLLGKVCVEDVLRSIEGTVSVEIQADESAAR